VFNSKSEFNDYVTLFEDTGWKHVYGTFYSGSQYFCQQQNSHLRFLTILVFSVLSIVYGIWAVKAKKSYNKSM